MFHLTTYGPARDRGIQHGRAIPPAVIQRSLGYSRWTEDRPEQWREVEAAMWRFLQDRFPEIVAEIEGIGEGTGIGPDAARHLNLFSAAGRLAGCTNLGFTRSDRGPILAKTLDIGPNRDVYMLHRVIPDEGYAHLRPSWVGNAWAVSGVNEKGLAVGPSSAPTVPGQDPHGMPQHLTLTAVLMRCANVPEAIELLTETPLAGMGHIYALMDADGRGAIVEKGGALQGIIEPEHNVIFTSNHYRTEPLALHRHAPGPALTSSLARAEWMQQTFIDAQPQPELTLDALTRAVKHDRGDGRICRKGWLGGHTHFAFIYVPSERAMYSFDGYPCENAPVEHRL